MDHSAYQSWIVVVAAEQAEARKDWRVQPNRRVLQEEQRRRGRQVVPKHQLQVRQEQRLQPIDCFEQEQGPKPIGRFHQQLGQQVQELEGEYSCSIPNCIDNII
jgi:hypothetical protein